MELQALMEVTLLLPWPGGELSPNYRHRHWSSRHRANKAYRELIAWECKAQAPRIMLQPPVTAQVTFLVGDRRERDVDNLQASLKAAWDGMVDAGLLQDDRASMLKHERPEVEYQPGEKRVQVTLSGAAR